MTVAEHRNPLSPRPLDSVTSEANVIEITDSPTAAAKPRIIDITEAPTPVAKHHDNDQSVDDLAASVAKKLNIAYDDDEFHEVNGKKETVDWKKENKEMDKMFESQAARQLQDLPPFEKPRGFKKSVTFYDHQQDGIRWLVQQERNAPPNPFVRSKQLKDGTTAFYDRLTRHRIEKAHAPIKGSLLCDDMGLGKTIQTMGLILSNPPKGYVYGKTNGANLEHPVCTLVVCPKSVISNWITQIDDFIKPGKLRVVTYTGTPKQRSKIIGLIEEDNSIDILLSTYETISSEHDKDREGLLGIHDISFHRIVLDEAQQIRNNRSKVFKAIEAVAKESEYRLALTGTPFVNKPEDIMSLLAFIGLEPLANETIFRSYISDPIKDRKRAGLTRLRAALAYVALRRTKNILPDLAMPDKNVEVCKVEFPEGDHKDIHDVLFLAAQAAFEASINGKGKEYTESEGGVTANAQQAMFSLLMRVRQSCASGSLVSAGHYEAASEVMGSMMDENGNNRNLTVHDGNRMIDRLQRTKPDNDERLSVKENSPKVNAILKAIGEMKPDEKAVIFSQWTSFLDIIGTALRGAGHKFTRIDGSMTTEQRTAAMQALSHDDDTRFILCSLKAAGVGINLTRANWVIMSDPWWNASIESQAIDRVHRFGQTRPVNVVRLVMKDTIEERMLNVQKAKSALGKGTMTKLTREEEKTAKVTSLKDLFQIKETEDEMPGFIVNKSDDWY